MSTNVDDLVIRATIKDEITRPLAGIRDELGQVQREVRDLGAQADRTSTQSGRMTRSFGRVFGTRKQWSSFGQTAQRSLGWVALGISGVAGAAATLGVKTASQMQNATIAFETMLGSAQKAQRFLTDLKKFAKRTPFTLTGLIDNSQRLLAMGFTAKEVIPTLTAVGDAAAGAGGDPQKLNQLVTALGQIRAKGKASAEEMMQINEAGIGGWSMLADHMGKTVPEVMKMVTDGQVDAQTTITALTEGMNKKFGGLMKKQSETMAGEWASLKDNLSQTLGDLVMESGLLEGLTDLTEFINDEVMPAVTDFFDEMKAGEGVAGTVGDVLEAMGDVLADVFGWMGQNKEVVATFIGVLAGLTLGVAAFNAVLAVNPITLVILAIAALAAGVVYLYKKNETFREGVNQVWDALKPLAEFIGETLVWAFKKLVPVILRGIADQIRAFNALWQAVFWVFDKILAAAEKGLGWIPGLGGKIRSARRHFDTFGEGVNNMLNGVADELDNAATKIDNLDKKSATATVDITANTKPFTASYNELIRQLNGRGSTTYDPGLGGLAEIVDPATGDTRTRRGYGHGRVGRTLAHHGAVSRTLGGGYRVSNALVGGGGGHGHGSGDHQAGRAVDVTGRNLPAYAREVRRRGGYAAIHGQGGGKHVHAVMGDTATSRRPSARGGGAGAGVTIAAGAVEVHVHGGDPREVKQAVKQALLELQRDFEEMED